MPVRRLRSASALSISARMLSFAKFCAPISRAVFGLYPARMAAWVAQRSTRYSSTKRRYFSVSLAIRSPSFRRLQDLHGVLVQALLLEALLQRPVQDRRLIQHPFGQVDPDVPG